MSHSEDLPGRARRPRRHAAALLLALCLPPAAAAADPPLFAERATTLHSCCYVNAVLALDLDGDGRVDVVAGNGLGHDFSVFLGTGRGGFAEPVDYAVGAPQISRVALAAGDLDGDGHPDIVATGTTATGAWLYRGRGDGSFEGAVDLALGDAAGPRAVAIGDLDRDGVPDVVVANGDSETVSVLFGDGDGGFAAPISLAIPGWPAEVAIGEVTGDGHPDIVLASAGDEVVAVLAGDGARAFATPLELPLPAQPAGLAVGDLDGDGIDDIAVSTWNAGGGAEAPGAVAVLLASGDGGFAEPALLALDGVAGRGQALALADMTGDGHRDIVVAQPNGNAVSLFANDGAGGFGARVVRAAGSGSGPVAVADVDGDGHPDVVTGNSENVSILPGDGGGDFGFPRHPVGAMPHGVAAADLDGDGVPELATADMRSNTVTVLGGDGEGGLVTLGVHAVGDSPTGVASGDLDGDGHLDLVSADFGGGSVSVLLGDGAGGFAAAVSYPVSGDWISPYAIAVGDANGDGHLDVATANTNLSDDSVTVLLGDGSGALGPGTRYDASGEAFANPRGIAFADVTGDGHDDVVVANNGSSELALLVADGDGGFAGARPLQAGQGPVAVAAVDVDGDGILDLVSLDHPGATVSVLRGDGVGGFGAAETWAIADADAGFYESPWPWGLAVADVDGDGSPDIVTANTQSDDVSVLPNDGGGAFPRYYAFGAGAKPGSVAVADVDGDGRADIVVANRANDDVAVLRGGGDPTDADLAVGVVADDGVAPGGELRFEVLLDNLGPASAAFPGLGLAVDAALPDLAVAAAAGWSCGPAQVDGEATSVACAAASLAAGASAPFVATATAPDVAGTVTLAAAATAQTPDPVPGNDSDSASVAVGGSDLAVAVTGPDTYVRGDTVAFAVALANAGPGGVAGAGLEIAADVPAAAVAVSPPAGWQCVPRGGHRFVADCAPEAAVAPGEVGFAVEVAASGRAGPPLLQVRAAVSSAQDPEPANDRDAHSARLVRAP